MPQMDTRERTKKRLQLSVLVRHDECNGRLIDHLVARAVGPPGGHRAEGMIGKIAQVKAAKMKRWQKAKILDLGKEPRKKALGVHQSLFVLLLPRIPRNRPHRATYQAPESSLESLTEREMMTVLNVGHQQSRRAAC